MPLIETAKAAKKRAVDPMSFTLSEKSNSSNSPTTIADKSGRNRGGNAEKAAKNHRFIFYGLDRPNQRGGSRTFKQKDKFIHYDVSATKSYTKTVDDIISTTTSPGTSAASVGVSAAVKNACFDTASSHNTTAVSDVRVVAAAAAEVRRYKKKSRFINYGLQDEGDEPDIIMEHQKNQNSSTTHMHNGQYMVFTDAEPTLTVTGAPDASTGLFRLKPSHNVPATANSSIVGDISIESSNQNINKNNNNCSTNSANNSAALMGVFAASPKSDIWAHFQKTVLGDQQYTDKRTGKLKWEVRYECRFENCKYVGYASKIQGSTSPLRYHYKTHVKAAAKAAAAVAGKTSGSITEIDSVGTRISTGEHYDDTTVDEVAAAAAAVAVNEDTAHTINTLIADFLTKHGLPPAIVDDSLFRYLLRTGPLDDGAIMNSVEIGQLLHMRRQLAGLGGCVNSDSGVPSASDGNNNSSGHDNMDVDGSVEKRQKLS